MAGTEADHPSHAVEIVQRHARPARWYHAVVYLTTGTLLGTGVWLWMGHEGDPSLVARLLGTSDVDIHRRVGWLFAAVAVAGATLGARAARTLALESVRFRRADAWWFLRWPRAVVTGRFEHHDGSFDPGQRIANLVMVGGLLVLLGSGVGLVLVHGGTAFVVMHRLHLWATYVLTPVIAGHVLVASGIAPGYRGVWRSMHWGGRLHGEVAQRLWPAWFEHHRDVR